MGPYTINTHRSGDTWFGLVVNVLEQDRTTPVDLTGASIAMQVKENGSDDAGDAVLDVSTASGITISDPTGGQFTVDKRVVTAAEGQYKYDIQVTLANGDVLTVLDGTWQIDQDVTR